MTPDADTQPVPLRPLVREQLVPEHEVQQVMRDLGFDYLQARAHVKQRMWIRAHVPPRRVE